MAMTASKPLPARHADRHGRHHPVGLWPARDRLEHDRERVCRRAGAAAAAAGRNHGAGLRAETSGRNAEAAWRLKLAEARHLTVKGGFAALAAAGHRALPDDLAIRLADRFTAYREEEMFVFPGAHDAIDTLKALGIKLALVTNGAADMQRAKVERFELAHRFDHIQIEGEHGFGKPEERAYLHAMEALGVSAAGHLDDRRQSGMGSGDAAAPRHLLDLDRRARRRPAGGLSRSSPTASSAR